MCEVTTSVSRRRTPISIGCALRSGGFASLLIALAATAHAGRTEISAEPAQFFRAYDITVDGSLNEPAWKAASPVTTFYETYPRSIAAPTVLTEARFLHDDQYIYIGVTAHDPRPDDIRSGLVRRDNITIDQDYIEILIDPLNTKRGAFVFTTNPNGARNDGQFNEVEHTVDTRPDLEFDVEASVGRDNWQAEFRIPLTTFRYRAGKEQTWTFVINRNIPRLNRILIQSIPEPRQATCTLCFGGELRGISLDRAVPPLFVTPQVTYAHSGDDHRIKGGLDAKWVPSSDTIVDLTLLPDFSQVEADDLQLTANSQFTLAVKEKRPFFLEGADVFQTPIQAIYTRSFGEPTAGLRITKRAETYDFSALLLRDQSGGLLLEPGSRTSSAAVQPFDSTAMAGRYEQQLGHFTVGALTSARLNSGDRGGENYLLGVDGTWAPTTSDRIALQALTSTTTNPDRPDLQSSWDGRHLAGSAYSGSWQHASDRWYATILQSAYASGFRAWNGFVPQVDVSTRIGTAGLNFYPDSDVLSRVSSGFVYSSVRELGGSEISAELYPSLTLTLPRSTELVVNWSPNAKNSSSIGPRTYDYWSITLSTTPATWMPGLTVVSSFGEGIDFRTGAVNKAQSLLATVPLRLLDRLELVTSVGYQAQDSKKDGERLFTEQDLRVDALWHFSAKLYIQAAYQHSRFDSAATDDGSSAAFLSRDEILTALLSYQANWQTRYFVGVRRNTFGDSGPDDTQLFAKFSYVLPKWN